MDNKYLLADETITQDDLQVLIDWLGTNPWLTQGKLVQEFERKWASWVGTDYATFVNSGSSANLLMYYSLLVSNRLKNKKIIVPAVSWSTTVAPAIQLGFEPIMCEADWETFGLDLNHLERLLEEHNPGSVIIVHVLGVPNEMESLIALKERFGFELMEDACAATGSRYDGQLVGSFGDLSSFSFYYGHHMSTIEGGMVCTSDEQLHDLLLQLRSHGWAKDLDPDKELRMAQQEHILDFNRPFTFYQPGFNVRSTELNAKLGLSQMDRLETVITRRMENHQIYQARFLDDSSYHFQQNHRADISSISFGILASSLKHRDQLAELLRQEKIETRPLGGGNMSRQPHWTQRFNSSSFKIADRIHDTSFQLPNHPILTPIDINHICDAVLSVKHVP